MDGLSILIVEDEIIVALDLQNRLQKLGYTVVGSAISGEEAIEIATQTQPDLIFMDVGLQGDLNGIETAEAIRHLFYVPVIFLTAYTDIKTKQRAAGLPNTDFLAKPFAEVDLANAISSVSANR